MVVGSKDKEEERLRPDAISPETCGDPAWAAARHCEKWKHLLARAVTAWCENPSGKWTRGDPDVKLHTQ